MQNQKNVNAAMNDFLKQLPDPKFNNVPAVIAEYTIKGEKINFMAQKAKGLTGLTWKVSQSMSQRSKRYSS
ncbi:hypothetical protein WG906_06710 [Pedobacter sp. P351]|uniref:hypothetical protein n=1 Tax=Pedobacter superstes TaxID=3133441 RepID=UPI003094B026